MVRPAHAGEESLDEVDALFVAIQRILGHDLQVTNRVSLGAWESGNLAQISSHRTT